MKLVTAIYSKLYNTKFGGRLNRDYHYLYSIKTLLKMGADIVCYTSEEEYNWLNRELAEFDNIELKVVSLSSYKHHDQIQKIKAANKQSYDRDAVWTYRCVELMWLKMQWLHDEAQKYDGKVFWIDAGLSHGGIIPSKFNIHFVGNGTELPYKESFENYYAFNDKLLTKVDKLSEKFFCFYCNHRQHRYPDHYTDYASQLPGSIVAGLMGGTKEAITPVYEQFDAIINEIMNNNDLIQEEMALTIIYKNSPELFSISNFDTWYHVDWACYNPEMISFSSFFEDLDEWV